MNPLAEARSAIDACNDLDEAEEIFSSARERRNRLRVEAVRIGSQVMLTDVADRILNGLTGSPVLIDYRTGDILMDASAADVVRRNPEAVTYRVTDHDGRLVIHGIPLASCYSHPLPGRRFMTTYDDLTTAVLAGIDRDALRAAASRLTRHGHNPAADYNGDRPDAPISVVSAIEQAAMDIDTRDRVARNTLQTFATHLLKDGAHRLSGEDSRRAIREWETSADVPTLTTALRQCAAKSARNAGWSS